MNVSLNIFLSVIICFLLHFFSYQPYGFFPHILAVISFFVIAYTGLKIINNGSIEDLILFPFLLLNWLYFQSPFLLENKTMYLNRIIDERYIDEIGIYTFFSIFLIYIGFNFFNNSVSPLTSKTFKFSSEKLRRIIILFVVIGTIYRIGEQLAPFLVFKLSNLIQILFYAPSIVVALYVVYSIRKKESKGNIFFHLIVVGFILVEILIRLSTTLFANIVVLLIGGLLAYYHERGKIPIVSLIVVGICFYPIYEARKYLRFGVIESTSTKGQIELGREVFENAVLNENIDSELEEFDETKFNKEHNRFENLSFISQVVRQHKTGNKEFLHGETFYWLPLVPIPRILFPSKPINELSTTIATEYGLRGIVSNASINFPMVVEGYINFGFNGMLIMAFIFGLSYKWFAMKFGMGIGDINLIILVNSFKQFMHAEGNITLVFGALIQVLLFWWIMKLVLKLEQKK